MAKHVFTGVFIPANIWLSKELSPAEKMILGEVEALSKETGWCYAGRKHFTEWLHCTPPNVTYYINNLERLGYLKIERNPGERSRMQVINERFYSVGSKEGLPVEGSKPSLPGSKPSLLVGSKEDLPGSKEGLPASYIKDKSNNKIQNKDNAENPLSPPFTKTDLVIGIHDSETPGCVIVDFLPLEETEKKETPSPGRGAPKVKPEKSGRIKQPRNEPTIHPENEVAFQHFNDPEKARAAWSQWIKYKFEQFRDRYKSADSELIKLRALWKDTNGDAAAFEKNISHSIGSLYKGIFPPKEEKTNGTNGQSNRLNKATAQHLDIANYVIQRRQAAMERAVQNGSMAGAPTDWEV